MGISVWGKERELWLCSIVLELTTKVISLPPSLPPLPLSLAPLPPSSHTRKSQRSMLVTSVLCLGLSVRQVTHSSAKVLLDTQW